MESSKLVILSVIVVISLAVFRVGHVSAVADPDDDTQRNECSYSLGISPQTGEFLGIFRTWHIDAEDSSKYCGNNIDYKIVNIVKTGTCYIFTGITPTSFRIARGSSLIAAFNVTIVRSGGECRLSFDIIDPDGNVQAHGLFSVKPMFLTSSTTSSSTSTPTSSSTTTSSITSSTSTSSSTTSSTSTSTTSTTPSTTTSSTSTFTTTFSTTTHTSSSTSTMTTSSTTPSCFEIGHDCFTNSQCCSNLCDVVDALCKSLSSSTTTTTTSTNVSTTSSTTILISGITPTTTSITSTTSSTMPQQTTPIQPLSFPTVIDSLRQLSKNNIRVFYFYNPPNPIKSEILSGINSARQFWSSVVDWKDYNFADTNDRNYFEIYNIYSLPVALVSCFDEQIRITRSDNFHIDLNNKISYCYNRCKSGECSKPLEIQQFEQSVINKITDPQKSENVKKEVREFKTTSRVSSLTQKNISTVNIPGITDSQKFLIAVAQKKDVTIISGIKEESVIGFTIEKEKTIAIDNEGNIISVKEDPTFVAVIKSMVNFWSNLFKFRRSTQSA